MYSDGLKAISKQLLNEVKLYSDVQIDVSGISSSEEELNKDDDVPVIQFEDALEVPIDNFWGIT